MEGLAEDRRGEPLVHREHEVPQRLDERPLAVDRLVQRVVGERLRPGDRRRPRRRERRPGGAHALGVGGTEHRPQRVPRVALVHVGGDVDAVDDEPVDQRVDVDVDEPGVADRGVGEVDVAEACAAQVGAPEHRSGEIALELLRHCTLPSSHGTTTYPRRTTIMPRSTATTLSTRRARVSAALAPVIDSACARCWLKLSRSHAARAAGSPASTAARSDGTSTTRGWSSTSSRTSTSSPAPRPVAARVWALNEISDATAHRGNGVAVPVAAVDRHDDRHALAAVRRRRAGRPARRWRRCCRPWRSGRYGRSGTSRPWSSDTTWNPKSSLGARVGDGQSGEDPSPAGASWSHRRGPRSRRSPIGCRAMPGGCATGRPPDC